MPKPYQIANDFLFLYNMTKIPLFMIHNDDEDAEAVDAIIRSGREWSSGRIISEFERGIAEYIGVRHCICFNSGGTALNALMMALGIRPHEQVHVPSFTFIATAFAPLYVGARSHFIDIEENRLGLDPAEVKKGLGKDTKAVMPIHHGGTPCKVEEILEAIDGTGIPLIEDAAEAFGATSRGRKVGTFGRASIFSFCQNKIFTTGEGGCAVTDDGELAERLRLIASYGRVTHGDYFNSDAPVDYIIPGNNWRLSSIQAALGMAQLKKVDRLIAMRRRVASTYGQELAGVKGIELPLEEDWSNVYQMYTVRLPDRRVRDGLISHLDRNGVACKVYFHPVHEYSVFKGDEHQSLPVTKRMSDRVLSLPIYPDMSDEDISYVSRSITTYLRGL